MRWPREILVSFFEALEIEPAEGLNEAEVIHTLLDETARRAVWRAQANPENLRAALSSPYTPLGSLVASCVEGRATSLMLKGSPWGAAVDALYDYMEENAQAICDAYQDEQEPYDDGF
jgi:hypothetical protein